jgi:hypothetical protein
VAACARASPNGNPEVDERGAVCGPPLAYVCSQDDVKSLVLRLLVGVEGGVSPSASVISSQIGKPPDAEFIIDAKGEVMGAERETFIITDWVRVCRRPPLLLVERGTATALDGAGVGVLGAAAGR